MAGLADLARRATTLDETAIEHCLQLVGSWSLLSDLSFSDLLLYAPVDDDATRFVVLGHTRSVTGGTVHLTDPVGRELESRHRPELRRAYVEGVRLEGLIARPGADPTVVNRGDPTVEENVDGIGPRLGVDYVPVRRGSEVVAVLARERDPQALRHPSPSERRYRDVWERFAAMVAAGAFPLERSEQVGEFREPRVGDGVIILDRQQRIEYASPNAISALHRLGVHTNVDGRTLSDLGVNDRALRRAFSSRHSTVEELEQGASTVIARCHPLVEEGRVSGAVLLLRDISELRRRDRLLVSKDATIREIHHRVKNNLQTIQSLLRLQSRRLDTPEARAAIEQSARRIGSIAIVHETLSTDTADVVDFDSVAARVVGMVEEGLGSAERPIRVEIDGALGELDGDVAMRLAVVLTELVQNAIDHAAGGDVVSVALRHLGKELEMRVADRGAGVPEGFALDRDAGLGLTIVRTFVVHDLGGSISIGRTMATPPYGTVVDVRVPNRPTALPVG